MGAAGQQLGLRLFLEGLEVPCIGAQVQIGINAPATASIQVVPGERILELKARTMVHLFFWDYTQDNSPVPIPPDPARVAEQFGVDIDQAKDLIADNPELFSTPEDEQLRGYKLLFSGEVIGITLMKTSGARQAVLQCSDFSTYWDTTYQFFVSYSPNGNFLGTSAAVWAGSDSMFDDLTAGHTSVMNEYLTSKPQTPGLQGVKGLMGGIIALLEAMGGVPKHTHGINDFFTIAELKNHILQQIVTEQNDDTAQRLFDNKAFSDWLSRGMSSLGQLTTFRDMMKLLFKYVYYEVIPNPAAMYVPHKRSDTKTTRTTATTKIDIPSELSEHLSAMVIPAGKFLGMAYEDPPFDEDRLAKTFKTNLKNVVEAQGMPRVYRTKLEKAYTWLDKIRTTANRPVATTTTSKDGTRSSTKTTVSSSSKSNVREIHTENRKCWKRVFEILLDVLGENARLSVTKTKVKRTAAELDRLHTQIFRPDCFFVAPPRCNVLFPDQYTQFTFSKNHLQEITRLRLHEEWEFGINEGLLETNVHFAPAMKEITELAKKQGNSGIRALLPWEIYSGILPKFETVHEVNYVAGQAERKRGIKGNIKGAAVNYTQRVANFNYLKYRFASRGCEVSGKFNPFLVCGFPTLIIDKPFILDPEKAEKIRDGFAFSGADDTSTIVKIAAGLGEAPTQYIGMIASISHSVQQDAGSTSIAVTHARTHRVTDDDFLGMLSTEISKQLETDILPTVLDADELLKKGDFRLLKFLKDSTPQDLEKVAEEDSVIDFDTQDSEDSPPLETRPDGSPELDEVASLVQFGSLLATPQVEFPAQASLAQTQSRGYTNIAIRGRTKKDRLKNSRDTILVPDGGDIKLNPGSKGPRGGKITQIQCVTDAAIGIVGQDTSRRLDKGQKVNLTSSPVDRFTRDPESGKLVLQGNTIDSSNVTYFWKKIVIYEEVKVPKKATRILPVEEGIRPPWFSPLYSNWFIGAEIYEPFFGCGSIVDQALFSSQAGNVVTGTGREQQQSVLDQLKAAGNDRQKVLKILDDAKARKITDVPDIESSVDVLAYTYGEIRRLGLDVHRFIHDYTRRPIATMEEMFGSTDLTYSVQGSGNSQILKQETGTSGFHSTAIAPYGELLGLLDNPDLELSRLKRGAGKKAPVSRNLDPRPGRRAKVIEYLQEINASSGSLGVGVPG